MTRVKEANRVQAYCQKHKRMTEHMEYVMQSNFGSPSVVYKCLECYHDAPFQYPVYGKQATKLETKKQVFNEQHFGRQVA